MIDLFVRDDCVSCPNTALNCDCNSDEVCTLVAQTCTTCASIRCEKAKSSSLSGGGIAGIVVGCVCGGLLLLAIFVYYFKYARKNREAPFSPQSNGQMNEKAAGSWDTDRHSRHSAQLFPDANVIPIAYIPELGHTKSSLPGTLPKSEDIRDSIAASNYRASIPNYVMAVQGQPSMVDVERQAQQEEARQRSLRLESISELTGTPLSNNDNSSGPMPGNSDLNAAFESSVIFDTHESTHSPASRNFLGTTSIREISNRVDVNSARLANPTLHSIHFDSAGAPSNTGSFRLSEFSFDTTEAHGNSWQPGEPDDLGGTH